MTESVSLVTVTLKGGTFNLLADIAAMNRLERKFKRPWFHIVAEFSMGTTIETVAEVFASFAISGGSEALTADDVIASLGPLTDYSAALDGLNYAVAAAMPAKKEPTEGGGDASDDSR